MARRDYIALIYLAAAAVASVFDLASGHVEPRIALRCGYKAQFVDLKTGAWTTDDSDELGGCDETLSRKQIFDVCKKVYAEREVTNYVDGNAEKTIDNWCPLTGGDCSESFTTIPIRCLFGQFESDALLVPKKCKFEHIHRDQKCLSPKELSAMASEDCQRQTMELHDYGVLLPCKEDFNRFEGVEFVCCPSPKPKTQAPSTESSHMETSFSTATSAPSEKPFPDDEYFKQSSLDMKQEHSYYESARKRLQDKQDARLSRVMQQWQEAQRQYENLKTKDPKGAKVMQEAMLSRFDDTMASLEIDANKEHEQLRETHQQRLEATFLDRRLKTEQAYAETLKDANPKAKKILHALQKHLKAIQKDRQHRVNHFKHLRETDPEKADMVKQSLMHALNNMDIDVQQCIDMLRQLPDVYADLQGKVDELLMDSETTQDHDFMDALATMIAEDPTEEAVITEPTPPPTESESVPVSVDDILDYVQDIVQQEPSTTMMPEPPVRETGRPEENTPMIIAVQPLELYSLNEVDQPQELKFAEVVETVSVADTPKPQEEEDIVEAVEILPAAPVVAAQPVVVAQQKPKPKAAAMKQEGLHRNNQKSFKESSVKKVAISPNSTPAVAFGLACGVLAVATVVVVAVVIVRKKTRRTPVNQGFAEIDPNMTVEQRHIASMQASGYENPTYKYFEMQ